MIDTRQIQQLLASAAQSGLLTHAYVARGRLSSQTPEYDHALLPDGRDLFDLASLTKALVTTPLAFCFRDKLGLTFEQSLAVWLKDKGQELAPRLRQITVATLLAHTSGLPAWRNFWVSRLSPSAARECLGMSARSAHMVNVLNRTAEQIAAKKVDVYSDVGFILLGLVLELIGENSLDVLFKSMCEQCLYINNFDLPMVFNPPPDLRPRAIPTGKCYVRERDLVGEVHDENCAALDGVSGHAGLFATGPALCRYLVAFAASALGREVIKANAAARELNEITPQTASLLGWRQGADASSLPYGGGKAMGHMGFTGVAWWLYPELDEYVVLLTNRVIGGRTKPGIAALRRDIFTLLAAR